jgi:hypothetical protein
MRAHPLVARLVSESIKLGMALSHFLVEENITDGTNLAVTAIRAFECRVNNLSRKKWVSVAHVRSDKLTIACR